MKNNEELDLISCQLIALVGSAKSSYIEALQYAKNKEYKLSEEKIKEAKKVFIEGHNIHLRLLQMSTDDTFKIQLLLIHAEDQMMSCETIGLLVEELIQQQKRIDQLEEKEHEYGN